jgi:hypothetical protein
MLPDGDEGHDDRLHEVHPGACVRVAKNLDRADDKRRHQVCERDLSDHTSSDQRRVTAMRMGDDKTVTPAAPL